MFGEEDRFLNLYANASAILPKLPLLNGGAAKLSPVFVGDVARVVSYCATSYAGLHAGQTYDLPGKEEYTVKEILDYIYEMTEADPNLIDFPADVMEKLAKIVELFPDPPVTQDLIRRMVTDEVSQPGNKNGFEEVGVEPSSFEKKAFNVLYRFRTESHFANVSS